MNPIKILVLEDQPLQRMQIEETLSEHGYEVIAVGSVREAKQMLRAHKFSLALLDIQMEGEDDHGGIKVGQEIRGSMPFIYLTAREDLFEKAIPTLPDDFIAKPYHPEDILRKVKLTQLKFYGENTKISGGLSATPRYLRVKVDGFWEKIAYEHITFVQADGNDTIIFTNLKHRHQGTQFYHISGAQFGRLAKRLLDIYSDRFQRVHRTYIVSKPFIERYNRSEIFIEGYTIPIGEKYKKQVAKWIGKDN